MHCVDCRTRCDDGDTEERDSRTETETADTRDVHEYYGETSRGAYVRFGQHTAQWNTNFMGEHTRRYHPELRDKSPNEIFSMSVYSTDTDPMRRILRESIRIRQTEDGEDRTIAAFYRGDTARVRCNRWGEHADIGNPDPGDDPDDGLTDRRRIEMCGAKSRVRLMNTKREWYGARTARVVVM